MTPMHNLMVMAAIANDGITMKPYFVDHVENPGGQTVKKFKPEAHGELMVANEAAALKELLVRVVNEGTGSSLRTDAYQAAGKTGSAEFETGRRPMHGLWLCACGIRGWLSVSSWRKAAPRGRTAAPLQKLFDAYLIPETGFLETAGKKDSFFQRP